MIDIVVSHHAQWRAAERFRICRAEQLEEEVRAAFDGGRVSALRPPGVRGRDNQENLYAWTPDCDRVYLIDVNQLDGGKSFMIVSVVRPER